MDFSYSTAGLSNMTKCGKDQGFLFGSVWKLPTYAKIMIVKKTLNNCEFFLKL